MSVYQYIRMERRLWEEELARDMCRLRKEREEKALCRLAKERKATASAWAVFHAQESKKSIDISRISHHSSGSSIPLPNECPEQCVYIASRKRRIRARAASSRTNLRNSWLFT
jgi:hypothetical protein